ncbi:MAG: glycosyltransferase family 4 protein [Planctomycetota bacterium]
MIAPCPFFILRGKPIRILNNITGVAMLGHDVDVVTYSQGEPLESALPDELRDTVAGRVTLHRISDRFAVKSTSKVGFSPKKIGNAWNLYRKAMAMAKTGQYDLLYCHDVDAALIGLRIKKRTGLPMLYDMHGSFRELMSNIHGPAGKLSPVFGFFEKRFYRGADVVLANWPHLVPVAREFAGNDDKVVLVQDKPPLGLLRQLEQPQRNTQWKDAQGIDKMLLYTGNFAAYQRVDILLGMMKVLETRGLNATLVLAGNGYEESEAQARSMGLDENTVRFVGPKYGDELYQLLMNADVALSARVTENYPPMKVITYLMARLPTVATDLPSHRMMVEHDQTGLLCPPDAGAFAQQVIRWFSDEPLRRHFATQLDEAAQRYTFQKLLDELGDGFSRLPNQSPDPTPATDLSPA